MNNNNNNNYYKSQSSRVVEQQHDSNDTSDSKHIDTYSSIMNTHQQQQEDEYNNFNNKKRKKWFRLGMGALMIGGIMVGYARWYVHCLHDYNEQVNHIYMNHESQFIEQALRTALDTLNSDEHLTYLLNNVFQQCGSSGSSSDKSDKNGEYRIQMIPLSDLLLNNHNNNNNSDNSNGNSTTTSMVSDSIIYSDFKVQYSLLPDLCQMKKTSSTIHNNHSNNNRHSSGFVIDKCHTVVQSRECTLNFYFLIAPTNNNNNNNNGNSHVDRNAIVKVTMKSLDYPNRDLFNRVIHHTSNHTMDIHNMMIAANHMNGDGDSDDEIDNVNLSTVPNYYITRISVCQTDKLLPQLLMSSSSSLSLDDDDEEEHNQNKKNKNKKNKKHWTMDPLSPSNVPPSPQLLLVNNNNSSNGGSGSGSDAVDSAQERLHVQHKLHMGGEVILEKASSIGGMIKGREGIKNVCHCYEKRRRCSLAQHFMS